MTEAPASGLLIERVCDRLPADLDAICGEALSEGHRHLARLRAEWRMGENRFQGDGERLYRIAVQDRTGGIGGLTRDRYLAGALRMRRFCVSRHYRRGGLGRRLALSVLDEARRCTAIS